MTESWLIFGSALPSFTVSSEFCELCVFSCCFHCFVLFFYQLKWSLHLFWSEMLALLQYLAAVKSHIFHIHSTVTSGGFELVEPNYWHLTLNTIVLTLKWICASWSKVSKSIKSQKQSMFSLRSWLPFVIPSCLFSCSAPVSAPLPVVLLLSREIEW